MRRPAPVDESAQPATGSPGVSWKAVRAAGRVTPDRSWAVTLLRSATERPRAWCGHSPAATRRLRSPHSRAGRAAGLVVVEGESAGVDPEQTEAAGIVLDGADLLQCDMRGLRQDGALVAVGVAGVVEEDAGCVGVGVEDGAGLAAAELLPPGHREDANPVRSADGGRTPRWAGPCSPSTGPGTRTVAQRRARPRRRRCRASRMCRARRSAARRGRGRSTRAPRRRGTRPEGVSVRVGRASGRGRS